MKRLLFMVAWFGFGALFWITKDPFFAKAFLILAAIGIIVSLGKPNESHEEDEE